MTRMHKGIYGTVFEGEKVRFEVLLLAVIIRKLIDKEPGLEKQFSGPFSRLATFGTGCVG